MLAVGLLLYVWRKVVEDRTGIPLREETPEVPPAERGVHRGRFAGVGPPGYSGRSSQRGRPAIARR